MLCVVFRGGLLPPPPVPALALGVQVRDMVESVLIDEAPSLLAFPLLAPNLLSERRTEVHGGGGGTIDVGGHAGCNASDG